MPKGVAEYLVFRSQAAAFAQARRMVWICSGWGRPRSAARHRVRPSMKPLRVRGLLHQPATAPLPSMRTTSPAGRPSRVDHVSASSMDETPRRCATARVDGNVASSRNAAHCGAVSASARSSGISANIVRSMTSAADKSRHRRLALARNGVISSGDVVLTWIEKRSGCPARGVRSPPASATDNTSTGIPAIGDRSVVPPRPVTLRRRMRGAAASGDRSTGSTTWLMCTSWVAGAISLGRVVVLSISGPRRRWGSMNDKRSPSTR